MHRLAWTLITRSGTIVVPFVRYAHKNPPPPCPNLLSIRKVVYGQLQPIHFEIQNDINFGKFVYDQHFKVQIKTMGSSGGVSVVDCRRFYVHRYLKD